MLRRSGVSSDLAKICYIRGSVLAWEIEGVCGVWRYGRLVLRC